MCPTKAIQQAPLSPIINPLLCPSKCRWIVFCTSIEEFLVPSEITYEKLKQSAALKRSASWAIAGCTDFELTAIESGNSGRQTGRYSSPFSRKQNRVRTAQQKINLETSKCSSIISLGHWINILKEKSQWPTLLNYFLAILSTNRITQHWFWYVV